MSRTVTLNVRTLVVAGLVALALAAAYLVGSTRPSPAQAATGDSTRTITVTGTGHVSVVPDQLGFQLDVSVMRDDLDRAMSDANAAMQSVVDTLKAQGVAEKDLQTTNVSVYPEYSHGRGTSRTLKGYQASETVTVTVEDLGKASDVVRAALAAGGTGVSLDGMQLQVSDPDSRLSPARNDALDQARAKAEEYAAHVGGELGGVVRISETTDQPYPDERAAASYASDAAGTPIEPGQQDLTANVVVVYELR